MNELKKFLLLCFLVLGGSAIVVAMLMASAAPIHEHISDDESLGGTVYNREITFDAGIKLNGNGSLATVTVGDAQAEDIKMVFDGNAQDYYIALDDSADDLLIGLGSTVATTPILGFDENQLLTTHAGITHTGTTPTVTIGDAGAEDTKIVFDGVAQDFYVGLDDTADDLVLGLGSTLGTTVAIAIDENQLVTALAGITMTGTTPTLTIGDAGTEDAKTVYDGAAQDFYIGLEDATDDLVFGVGSVLGTTQAMGIDENLLVTVSTELNVTNLVWGGGTDVAQTGVQVLTAAEMCDNTYIAMDPAGGSTTLTTDTAANLIADCIPTAGDIVVWFFENLADAAEDYTVTAGTNIDLLEPSGGDVVIAQNEDARFEMLNIDGTTVKIYVTSMQLAD